MAFIEELRAVRARAVEQSSIATAVKSSSPQSWHNTLTRLNGRRIPSGKEWVSSREVFDALALPEPARPSLSRRVARMMRENGWQTAIVGPRNFRQRGYTREITGRLLVNNKFFN